MRGVRSSDVRSSDVGFLAKNLRLRNNFVDRKEGVNVGAGANPPISAFYNVLIFAEYVVPLIFLFKSKPPTHPETEV